MQIQILETKAYGQFVATAQMPDGRQLEAWGLTPASAEFRLRVLSTAAPCVGCDRPVSAAEAAVCSAARLPVLCASCRSGRRPGFYDCSDPER